METILGLLVVFRVQAERVLSYEHELRLHDDVYAELWHLIQEDFPKACLAALGVLPGPLSSAGPSNLVHTSQLGCLLSAA